jgi:hypothetical protein
MLPIDVSVMLDIGLGQMENPVQVSIPSEILWNSASCFSLLSSFWMTFVTYTVKNSNVKQIYF